MTDQEYLEALRRLVRAMPRNVDLVAVVGEAERRFNLAMKMRVVDGAPKRSRAAYMRDYRRRRKNTEFNPFG